jgi:hypothetical protein
VAVVGGETTGQNPVRCESLPVAHEYRTMKRLDQTDSIVRTGMALCVIKAWLNVFASCLCVGAVAGAALFYLLDGTVIAWVFLLALVVAGLASGIFWAESIRRRGDSDRFCE